MINKIKTDIPLVSIGIPVYHAEKFIRKRLENILSQTCQDFEIIISVDPSNDSTQQICKEFAKKDNRISIFEQERKMGWVWSFDFVAEKAVGKYFVWAASDDLWNLKFLEKHVNVLESKKDIVACTCIFSFTGNLGNSFLNKKDDSFFIKKYKKIRRSFRAWGNISIYAKSYDTRAKICLRNFAYFPYAVFRTNEIKKSLMDEHFVWDWSVCMNILKFGNLHLINENLYQLFWDESTSTRKGLFHQFKIQNTRLNEYLFPYSSYTYWCIRNVGLKFFLKNFDFFAWLNFMGEVAIIKEIYLQTNNFLKRK